MKNKDFILNKFPDIRNFITNLWYAAKGVSLGNWKEVVFDGLLSEELEMICVLYPEKGNPDTEVSKDCLSVLRYNQLCLFYISEFGPENTYLGVGENFNLNDLDRKLGLMADWTWGYLNEETRALRLGTLITYRNEFLEDDLHLPNSVQSRF